MKYTLGAIAVSAVMAVSGASAATYNFDQDAQTFFSTVITGKGKYEGTFDQVYGLSAVDIDGRAAAAGTAGGNVQGGITVTASASNSAGAADPFMDSISGGKVAGLGVCSSGFQSSGKSKCSTNVGPNTGDDNLFFPEVLELAFSTLVKLTGLQIRDKDHNLINGETGALLINGTAYNTGANGQVLLTGLGSGTMFDFTSGTANKEIYLSVLTVAAVPVPASLPLLAGGLGLAGWFARRRKKSA